MESTNLLQVIYRSIGIAVGAIFSLYFMFKALACVTKNHGMLIAIACLSIVITTVTLIKNRKMHKG